MSEAVFVGFGFALFVVFEFAMVAFLIVNGCELEHCYMNLSEIRRMQAALCTTVATRESLDQYYEIERGALYDR